MKNPYWDILPTNLQRSWKSLADLPSNFVLYGGTALALQLGHRRSVDLDLFSAEPLAMDRLFDVPMLAGATIIRSDRDTVEFRSVNNVHVSIFGGLGLGQIQPPSYAEALAIASLPDLFGTKLNAIYRRAEAKDYLDVSALLEAGLELEYGLGCAAAIYGPKFNPTLPLKALAYFDDVQGQVPEAIQERLASAAGSVRQIPEISLDASRIGSG